MDHQLKFCELTGLSENRKYQLPSTSEALLQSGRYYREAFDKVAAKGELHAERIRNEISRILADMLQPTTRKKYGIADCNAIKRLIVESWDDDAQREMAQQQELALAGISQLELAPELKQILTDWVVGFPEFMHRFIASEAARLQLVPVENIGELTRVLSEMMEGENHADLI